MSPLQQMNGRKLGTAIFVSVLVSLNVFGQTPTSSPSGGDEKLEMISKKIDEQNKKIDLLSQEILKLEQQLTNSRPGVLIGEGAPNYPPTVTPSESPHPSV